MSSPFSIALAVALSLAAACCLNAVREAQAVEVVSPDGRNAIFLHVNPRERQVRFSVRRDGRELFAPAPCGPELAGHGVLADDAKVVAVDQAIINERFELPWGKTKQVHNHAATAEVELRSGDARWLVELRAYDHGVAFRYRVPPQADGRPIDVTDEATAFNVDGNPQALYSVLPSFASSHEAPYDHQPLDQLPAEKLVEMPLLLHWPNGPAAAITEARVLGFPGMYLQRESDAGSLTCRLSPLPGDAEAAARGESLTSPWRVVMLADRAGQLLESNLLVCLNDPPAGDFDWVRPGKTTMHWWNGQFEDDHQLPPDSTASVDRHKRYIDFCAENNIAYHTVSGDGHSWYRQSPTGYGRPADDADVTQPRPEIRLPEIFAYAKQRGVGIRLWVHWKPLSEQLEEAFAKYEQWGVRGLMVDFLDRDDQPMIDFTEQVLESAARHKLHIQFHGSSKPSGEERTFPNLVNREGVLNLEYLKWSDRCTPDHDVNVLYTRALAGLVDYHLGGFRAAPAGEFAPRQREPVILGSRCHQLALYVLLDNPMPMVADTPERYAGQPGFDFLTRCPTTWDETRFVAGEPGEYIVLARRSGDAWRLGGITNSAARKVDILLGFLSAESVNAQLYVDASLDGSEPNTLRERSMRVKRTDTLTVQLAPGGGFVAVLGE